VVDPKDTSVYVLVIGGVVLVGEEDHVGMVSVGVDNILSASYVVCCVIDFHNVVSIHSVIFEMDAVELGLKILSKGIDWFVVSHPLNI
jgi:hypothetical protein